MKGFKNDKDEFIPTEKTNKIGSDSINPSSEIKEGEFGFMQRGSAKKQLQLVENRETKVVKLENRANAGIRAYTDEIDLDNDKVVIEIGSHVVKGKYVLEPYWRNQEIYHPTSKTINDAEFDTFEEAKEYVEKVLNVKIVLDKENSNDYQSWKENIKQTDNILPFERVFWHLPENQRQRIKNGEDIDDFVKKGVKKKSISTEFLREQDFNLDLL